MSAVNEISKKKLHTGEIGNFHPVSSAPMLVLAQFLQAFKIIPCPHSSW